MVSKRRSNKEAGPSKKRAKADEKSKIKGQATNSTVEIKKKKGKQKAKAVKETVVDKNENLDLLEVKEEITEGIDIQELSKPEEAICHTNDSNIGVPAWPVPHIAELLRRIENVIPSNDHMAYKSRADKLNWNEIAFDDYSGSQCRIMWDAISKRVRRFRLLKELIDDAKVWMVKPWTNFYRGNKTNRHPDLPRRPLSTYMIFYLKKKDKILEEHPGLEMTDLSKHIAELYKKISPKTKEKYQELAALQRKEYDGKIQEFYRLHPELSPSQSKVAALNARTEHDNIPKKPPTPFKLYMEDKIKRSAHEEGFDKSAFLEKCKEQWKTMSDKKKVFWINWAFEKEIKFQEEIKKYMAENPAFAPGSLKSILTKDERTLRERMAGKPEKPPNSAYSLFSRLMLGSEDVKTVTPKERMLLIAQQWKNCTPVEKKEYNDRVKHMLEQYKLQYAEYLESLPEDKRQEELLNNAPKRKLKPSKPKIEEPVAKRTKKTEKKPPRKKVEKVTNSKTIVKKNDNLYQGEPEPPPATPYLMFAKTYQSSYPDRDDSQEVWENMSEEQRIVHRRVLNDLKKVYIESYENFLKGLSPEELKEYSEWKKTAKLAIHDSDGSSDDDSDSESDAECSSDSESEKEDTKTSSFKQEVEDNDDDDDDDDSSASE